MLAWIANNLSTILVGAAVAVLLVAVAAKLLRDKKRGKSSCGAGCANCPCGGACHTKREKTS